MKYWKVIIELEGHGIKAVDNIVITEITTTDTILINPNPISDDDSSEQSFDNEKDMYKMLWKQHNTPHYTRMPMTDKGKQMLSDFIPYIREKFPEIMI